MPVSRHDIISRLAHQLYRCRGGDQTANWYAAERLCDKVDGLVELMQLIAVADDKGIHCPSPMRHGSREAAVIFVEQMIAMEIV